MERKVERTEISSDARFGSAVRAAMTSTSAPRKPAEIRGAEKTLAMGVKNRSLRANIVREKASAGGLGFRSQARHPGPRAGTVTGRSGATQWWQ